MAEINKEALLKLTYDTESAEANIRNLTDFIEKNKNSVKSLQQQNRDYEKHLKKLNEELKNGKISVTQYNAEYEKTTAAMNDNALAVENLKKENQDLNKQRKIEQRILNSQADSIDGIRAQISKLTAERNSLSEADENEAEKIKLLNAQLDVLNEREKAQLDVNGKRLKSIGNYEEAIKKAMLSIKDLEKREAELKAQMQSGAVEKHSDSYKTMEAQLELVNIQMANQQNEVAVLENGMAEFGDGIQETGKKSEGFGQKLKALGKIPIVFIIGLVIGALASLKEMFTSSAEGSLMLDKYTNMLSLTFKKLQGNFSAIADIMGGAWEKFVLGFQIAGKKLSLTWSQLFGSEEDVARKTEELTALTQEYIKAEEKQNAAIAVLTDSFANLSEEAEKLANAKRSLELQDIKNTTATAKLNAELQKQNEIADDETKGWEERLKASERAAATEKKLAEQRLSYAKQQLDYFDLENKDLLKNNALNIEQQKQRAELQAAVIEGEGEMTNLMNEQSRKRRVILRDEWEQNLDIQLIGWERTKELYMQSVDDAELSFDERKRALQDLSDFNDASYQQQIKSLEEHTGKTIDFNELVKESDGEVLAQKVKALGFGEIENTRILEMISERKSAISDLNEIDKSLKQEEIDRNEDAARQLADIQTKRKLLEITNMDERYELLFADIERRRALELEDITLTETEKAALQAEFDLERETLQAEQHQKKLDMAAEEYQTVIGYLDAMNEAASEYGSKRISIATNIATKVAEFSKMEFENEQQKYQAIGEMANMAVDMAVAGFDRRLNALESEKQKELKAAGDNEELKEKINKKYAAKEEALQKKKFETEKMAAAAKVLINSAIGIATAIAQSPLTGGMPMAGIIGAGAALQLAAIASQKYVSSSYEDGGVIEIGSGHRSGNDINLIGISKTGQSQYLGTVEEGENISVTPRQTASSLNSQVQDYIDYSRMETAFRNALMDLNIYVKITEIESSLNNLNNIKKASII